MFIIGMALIVTGYTLVYYGVSEWQAYQQVVQQPGMKTPGGTPLSVLLGLSSGFVAGTQKGGSGSLINGSYPPFNFGDTGNGATPASSKSGSGSGTGSGVQAV